MGCPIACWISNADWGEEGVVRVWECQEGGAVSCWVKEGGGR